MDREREREWERTRKRNRETEGGGGGTTQMKNGKEAEKGTYNEKGPKENAKNTRKKRLHTN